MSQLASTQHLKHLHQLAQELNATKNDTTDTFSAAQTTTATDNESAALTIGQQQGLRAILEKGLPHAAQPYLVIAQELNTTEAQILAQIHLWQEDRLIKRFGLVVKHRKLGFKANAMVVWNIADKDVDNVAAQLSSCPQVSLCYRRPRRLPDWPYNLFCMIHGTDRDIVTAQIAAMVSKFSLEQVEKDILFSFKAYKQQGARYGKKGHTNG